MDGLVTFLRRRLLPLLAPGSTPAALSGAGIGQPAPRRQIDVADLLGRPLINLDTPELQRFLAGKRVLVTGAGGSIGSEICRQMMRFCPGRVILIERAENNLFEIDRELRERWIGADIRPIIADVCDAARLGRIFQAERPQVVFHCAAHKHVPMMEHNACEAIKNNVFGTRVVADAAVAAEASAFVLISTDKAVNPSSVMGATKRVAEMYVQSLGAMRSRCRLVAVRFGNVLGSSGSVAPIFQKQIEAGGPVTVTHPDMQRYFMTIPEASQLVMQAGAIGQSGEVLLLDMGSPVKIVDLARRLILRNGLRPGEDIAIKFTGIRKGEKLYEELSRDVERTRPTSHEKISVWQLAPVEAGEMSACLRLLAAAADATNAEAVSALRRCVAEYQPAQAGPKTLAPAHLKLAGGEDDAVVEAA